MISLIIERNTINESYEKPSEGIFWFIDNKLIAYMDPVGYSTNLDHKTIWESIKTQYSNLPFNYYPRGRVMVNERRDDAGILNGYDAYIYVDDCINTQEIVDYIKYHFNLSKCHIVYVGSDGGITSNHYKCHNCR